MSKILVVEDEKRLAALVEKGLQKYGFFTESVSNGEQALQAAQGETYDAILLDLGLPIKDGWVVLKELRHRGDDIPVIVMTAGEHSRQDVLEAGADDLVSKPFRFKDLLGAVQQQVE